jgi:hypothetical protein
MRTEIGTQMISSRHTPRHGGKRTDPHSVIGLVISSLPLFYIKIPKPVPQNPPIPNPSHSMVMREVGGGKRQSRLECRLWVPIPQKNFELRTYRRPLLNCTQSKEYYQYIRITNLQSLSNQSEKYALRVRKYTLYGIISSTNNQATKDNCGKNTNFMTLLCSNFNQNRPSKSEQTVN